MYLRKCIENHAIFQKYKRQKHCMFKVIFPKVPSQNKENKVSYLGIIKKPKRNDIKTKFA